MSLAAIRFAAILIGAALLWAGLVLYPGVFRISGHELDLIQALDVSYRMIEGARPHLDFMTPLGVLAFQPIAWFLAAGYGPGLSFLMAQVAVTFAVLPLVWWVGMSRLTGAVRLIFGIGMVALGSSMIFGAAKPATTGAMYYNRWAWILTFCGVLILMLRARPGWRAPVIDGLFVGVAVAVLVMTKVTFVIALLPFAFVAILQYRQFALFGVALVAAAALLAALTPVYGGVGFWQAYVGDLLAVALDSRRSYPGLPLSDLVASPAALPMTALLLITVIFWRNVGLSREGLALLVLAPGLVYITYQNWGNDPKWLFLLALLLLSREPNADAPAFWDVPPKVFSRVLATLALVLIAPSMVNILVSPVRHMSVDGTSYVPLFPRLDRADIEVDAALAYLPTVERPLPNFSLPASVAAEGEADPPAPIVAGVEIEDCELGLGFAGWTVRAVAQLEAMESAVGRPILAADIYDHLWLFGPFERVAGMAPWYYDTDRGFDSAAFVLVPHCPVSPAARRRKLEVIEGLGWILEEEIRTDLFTLFRRVG
ncbi:MAG: hypothetical protein AAGE76_00050 [Pseudomonadota bacterium]